MESFKRLKKISSVVNDSYPTLTSSNSSTLIMNYLNVSDLKNLNLPNISYNSKFKQQTVAAQKIGFTTSLETDQKYDTVILSVSKSKNESFAQIAIGHKHTKSGGLLIIEGTKSNGIDTIIKEFSKLQMLDHVIAKAHGKIAILKVSSNKLNVFKKWLTLDTPSKNEDGFYSIPGLFSYKKGDSASRFLTMLFDHKLSGDVIDLGAGWGFLSSRLLNESLKVKSITLVDHDQRAIDCAKRNIQSPKAIFKWLDIKEMDQFDSRFDNVICNPPFHSSKGVNVELGKNFIKASHCILKRAGSLLLVSNIQLPYESLIGSLFNDFSIVAKNKYFKVILAKKPKKL